MKMYARVRFPCNNFIHNSGMFTVIYAQQMFVQSVEPGLPGGSNRLTCLRTRQAVCPHTHTHTLHAHSCTSRVPNTAHACAPMLWRVTQHDSVRCTDIFTALFLCCSSCGCTNRKHLPRALHYISPFSVAVADVAGCSTKRVHTILIFNQNAIFRAVTRDRALSHVRCNLNYPLRSGVPTHMCADPRKHHIMFIFM